ncbi:MAG: hypothetical protein F4107_08575 [Gemmatimonadetes bacterium]|nr:hypothetical protein [Gemmatimonadota bacterium]MYD13970.1 hypothetical protein [Gemmatimonadota bacterium]MYI65971.1 hypothetical protein [Gemmatimonadota bacterium]
MALVDERVWRHVRTLERYGTERDDGTIVADGARAHPVTLPEGTELPAMMFRVATQISTDGFDQGPDLWRYEFALYDRVWRGVVDASRELLTAMSPITERMDAVEDVYIDAGEGAYARIVHLWIR